MTPFVVDELITPEICKALVVACLKSPPTGQDLDFWKGRVVDVASTDYATKRLVGHCIYLARYCFRADAGIELPEKTFSTLVRWNAGLEMKPHADNVHLDGTPNGMADRAFSQVIYLNSNYEGGCTYFPKQGLTVSPETGRLLGFSSGREHAHGVSKIESGIRFTLATWYLKG